MGGRWVYDRKTSELVPAEEYYARKYEGVQVSHLPRPMVISDYAGDVKSMVSGKFYDSKSALRREYKERGYIEVGNDPLKPPPKRKPDRRAIRESVAKAAQRVGL